MSFWHFITNPEIWPEWLAFATMAIIMNALAYMYIWAWEANFPA